MVFKPDSFTTPTGRHPPTRHAIDPRTISLRPRCFVEAAQACLGVRAVCTHNSPHVRLFKHGMQHAGYLPIGVVPGRARQWRTLPQRPFPHARAPCSSASLPCHRGIRSLCHMSLTPSMTVPSSELSRETGEIAEANQGTPQRSRLGIRASLLTRTSHEDITQAPNPRCSTTQA
jgi:hypothetical protein